MFWSEMPVGNPNSEFFDKKELTEEQIATAHLARLMNLEFYDVLEIPYDSSCCPECRLMNEGTLDFDGPDYSDDIIWYTVTCSNCGAKWTETYKRIGFEYMERGDNG